MTKIKLCGLSSVCGVEAANALRPDYVGFVFVPQSVRFVSYEQAVELKRALISEIQVVGVFVNEPVDTPARLVDAGVIDLVQLHGDEDDEYIDRLRRLTSKPIIKAFRIETPEDVRRAEDSSADYALLDSGSGSGKTFDWNLIRGVKSPFFLAGGLAPGNVREAVRLLRPFAVDVSSGVETNGRKDKRKAAAFIDAVRKADIE